MALPRFAQGRVVQHGPVRARQEDRGAEREVELAVDDERLVAASPASRERSVQRLEAERQELAEFSQNDEAEGNADESVAHGRHSPSPRCRIDVAVA